MGGIRGDLLREDLQEYILEKCFTSGMMTIAKPQTGMGIVRDHGERNDQEWAVMR